MLHSEKIWNLWYPKAVKTCGWLLLILMFLSSCGSGLHGGAHGLNLNAVPTTYENPETDNAEPVSEATTPEEKPESGTTTQSSKPALKAASKIITMAQKIMETEGRKLGTACNLFVHRVLQVSGFASEIFMANDFEIYAKRYFKRYKAEDFTRDSSNAEEKRLHNYIWAYPERTAFIVQWSRSGVHGHIAFVERIGEKLVIYQSSLGSRTARKDQTTVDILLNGYNRRQLTVYSEMTPK